MEHQLPLPFTSADPAGPRHPASLSPIPPADDWDNALHPFQSKHSPQALEDALVRLIDRWQSAKPRKYRGKQLVEYRRKSDLIHVGAILE